MLKIVVFDSGYGGEFFADRLSKELPMVEILRVINWRDAEKMLLNRRNARRLVEESLRPYINKVDLIILANYHLTLTTLNYFRRKYKKQKFIGLRLRRPDTFIKRDLLILSISPVSKTISFQHFVHKLNHKTKILNVDSWPFKIDDGELYLAEINQVLKTYLSKYRNFHPEEIVLASAQFNDIKLELRRVLGHNLKIYDGFDDLVREAIKVLNIRGGTIKQK